MKAEELLRQMRDDNVIPYGICERYQWRFAIAAGEPCTRAVRTLERRGQVDIMYFSGARAAVNLTEKGRTA